MLECAAKTQPDVLPWVGASKIARG